MKLLIVTQKVDKDDPILGFFHRWLIEFSKHCEKLTVICLQAGEYSLPANTKVLSLGKEDGVSRLEYLKRFFKYIRSEKNNYDAVFVHMNPIYVILGAIPWKTWGKKISLWYVHRNVDLKLRIAEKFVDKIFTASKESFNLPTDKLKIMGHGIPVEDFKKPAHSKRDDSKFRIISVGRITPIKNLDTLIEAIPLIKKDIPNVEVLLVGGPTQKGDEEYQEKLKKLVHDHKLENHVIFTGSVQSSHIKDFYWKSDLSVNLCPTGGVDKAVLESMASGLPVLVSNTTFADYFGIYGPKLMFAERSSKDLADKIVAIYRGKEREKIAKDLLEQVKKHASLESLIKSIVTEVK